VNGHAAPYGKNRADSQRPTTPMEDLVQPLADPISMDEWLRRLRAAAGVPTDAPPVSAAEQRALLGLARVAAHTSERVAAPISTYLLGVAMASLAPEERAAELERILAVLDAGD
jgi:hypothetical protein